MKCFFTFTAEDIEAGNHKTKFVTEPTMPIYLKVTICAALNANAMQDFIFTFEVASSEGQKSALVSGFI